MQNIKIDDILLCEKLNGSERWESPGPNGDVRYGKVGRGYPVLIITTKAGDSFALKYSPEDNIQHLIDAFNTETEQMYPNQPEHLATRWYARARF